MQSVHPEDRRATVRVSIRRAVKGERECYAAEYRMRTAAGDWKWMLSRGQVTRARRRAGARCACPARCVDIDARKRAEQAMRDAEERYRTLVELAPDGVVVYSRRHHRIRQPAAARHARRRLAQAAARPAFEDFIASGAPRALRASAWATCRPGRA